MFFCNGSCEEVTGLLKLLVYLANSSLSPKPSPGRDLQAQSCCTREIFILIYNIFIWIANTEQYLTDNFFDVFR